MKVMVWNVNGLRSACSKGFVAWLERTAPDVLGLQEVRAPVEMLPSPVRSCAGYATYWSAAARPGYSGVGLLTRVAPRKVETLLGVPDLDAEGRLQIADYGSWAFINAYFPKGSGKERDNSRVPFKLRFYEAVLEQVRKLRRKGRGVVVGGDYNTAHREIDLKNWKANQKTSGFLPEERAWIDRYLDAGLVDVFRERHPGEEGHYTWWSQRGGARERNVGWRIDYLMVTADLVPKVAEAWIEPHVTGSDHCPVGIALDVPAEAPAAKAPATAVRKPAPKRSPEAPARTPKKVARGSKAATKPARRRS